MDSLAKGVPPPHNKKSPAHSIKNILWRFNSCRERPKGILQNDSLPGRSLLLSLPQNIFYCGVVFFVAPHPGTASSSLRVPAWAVPFNHSPAVVSKPFPTIAL